MTALTVNPTDQIWKTNQIYVRYERGNELYEQHEQYALPAKLNQTLDCALAYDSLLGRMDDLGKSYPFQPFFLWSFPKKKWWAQATVDLFAFTI